METKVKMPELYREGKLVVEFTGGLEVRLPASWLAEVNDGGRYSYAPEGEHLVNIAHALGATRAYLKDAEV